MPMRKINKIKFLFMAGLFLFAILALFVVLTLRKQAKKPTPVVPTPVPKITFGGFPTVTEKEKKDPLLVKEQIIIKGVKVRDFYQFAEKPNDMGDVSLLKDDEYNVEYQ